MGGDKTKTIIDRKATARNQAASNVNQRSQFLSNYAQLFNGPTSNKTFGESLSGYYGGAGLDDIAKVLANQNVFMPKVKQVTHKVKVPGFLSKLIISPKELMNPVNGIRNLENIGSSDPMAGFRTDDSSKFNLF